MAHNDKSGEKAGDHLVVDASSRVARIWLNRPERRNAFDDVVARELVAAFARLAHRDDVVAVVLGGRGEMFCAGGDLGWMRRVAGYSPAENLADATAFQAAFAAIAQFPGPVVARVQGAAMGGGAGLAAAADLVVAERGTMFAFPEVRLGLVPGVISPYVLRRIGQSATRARFLLGDRFDADEALRIGLVDRVAAPGALDVEIEAVLDALLRGSPEALRGTKRLIDALAGADPVRQGELAREAIAAARASASGKEGTSAFLEKRPPAWFVGGGSIS